MVLVSWNLAGRVAALEEQLTRVLALDAGVVCLQELTPRTLPVWRERLQAAGYHVQHAEPRAGEERVRPLMVLTASRTPSAVVPVGDVPWPERVLATLCEEGVTAAGARGGAPAAAGTESAGRGLEVVNVHSPISPKPELAKVRTHLAVHRHLARAERRPRILCGDLNTPRREHADGTVWTFARDRYGRLRADRGEDWDTAELALLRGLEPYGFRDAFRELHGYGRREISWGWRRWQGGYRLDHLLVSGIAVERCEYEHAWRLEGLSDHSPLVARVGAG